MVKIPNRVRRQHLKAKAKQAQPDTAAPTKSKSNKTKSVKQDGQG